MQCFVYRLDCGHGFHLNCVENWLHNERTCPNCRTKVVGEGDAEEEQEERRQEDERRVQEDERVIQAAVARHVENRRSQRENRRIQRENAEGSAEGSAVEAAGSSERALVERMMASQPAEMVAEMQRTLGPTGMNTMEAILRGDDVDDIVQESMANPEQLARDLGNLLRAQTDAGRDAVMPPFMRDIMEGIRDGLGDSDEDEDDEDDGLGDSEDDSFPEESSEGEWESDFDSEALDSDDSADSDEIAARAAEARVLIMNRMNAAMNGGDLSALDSADEQLTEAMRVATAHAHAVDARAARAVADAGLDSDEERMMDERLFANLNAHLDGTAPGFRVAARGASLSDSDDSGPPELLDSDAEDESPDSEENARPRTRARMAARRAVRPPQRAWPPHEAQDVD